MKLALKFPLLTFSLSRQTMIEARTYFIAHHVAYDGLICARYQGRESDVLPICEPFCPKKC